MSDFRRMAFGFETPGSRHILLVELAVGGDDWAAISARAGAFADDFSRRHALSDLAPMPVGRLQEFLSLCGLPQ